VAGVTPRTRVIYISHVTSPTALTLPVGEVIRRARQAGILTVVDGAHAPGHVSLDLNALGADFYAGNCHKWLCAPKGAAFLHARRAHHRALVPPVISWGWSDSATLVGRAEQQGTRDPAAFLAVPDAIAFQERQGWGAVRAYCHALATQTRDRLAALTGLPPLAADDRWFGQMVTHPLPEVDAEALKRRLYDEFKVEVPVIVWNGRPYLRVSFQGYNTPEDADALIAALAALLETRD
jgi:isopenicillin-N epimerase